MLRCLDRSLLVAYNDDNHPTHTTKEQEKVEKAISKKFDYVRSALEIDPEIPRLLRNEHKKYLKKGLFNALPATYQCLDCSKPWLVYWITHSLCVLEDNTTLELIRNRACRFLSKCNHKVLGGFGGGPQQIPHLAATYAAVNAIVSLATEEALLTIDREGLLRFLCDVKQPSGSFLMHKDGEVDVRGVYCAVSVSMLAGLKDDHLFDNTSDWVLSCQTYEGGFAGVPGGEAHGGYTFCAVAALTLLGSIERCNMKALLRWVTNKQLNFEGGFAGRTNKLVDGCYSFWQGAIFPIIHAVLSKQSDNVLSEDKWLFNQQALQEYILCCCQESLGGLIDKPGRPRDYYHTCYNLSGLSIAQNSMSSSLYVGGVGSMNKVRTVHPIFNVNDEAVNLARSLFN